MSGKELEKINRNAREKRKNYFLGIEPIGSLNFIDLCCVIVLSQDINYDNYFEILPGINQFFAYTTKLLYYKADKRKVYGVYKLLSKNNVK